MATSVEINYEKIASAKKDLEILKEKIKQKKEQLGDTTLREACKDVSNISQLSFRLYRVLKGHLSKVYATAWSPGENKRNVVSASQDGSMIIWNAFNGNKLHSIGMSSVWVMSCAYSPTGNHIACAGLDNIAYIYGVKPNQTVPVVLKKELPGHTGFISSCKFLNERQLLTCSADKSCVVWDIETGKRIIELWDHLGDVFSISLSSDKNIFVSGSADMTAKVWDIRNGLCVQTFPGHQADINSVQFFHTGECFASGSDDTSIKLFDLRADRQLASYTDDILVSGVTSLGFTLSGRVLFAGYDDYHVNAWDSLKEERIGLLSAHENRVSTLSMSVDNAAMCSGSWDSTLKIWA